jgi:hypothetical protein
MRPMTLSLLAILLTGAMLTACTAVSQNPYPPSTASNNTALGKDALGGYDHRHREHGGWRASPAADHHGQ